MTEAFDAEWLALMRRQAANDPASDKAELLRRLDEVTRDRDRWMAGNKQLGDALMNLNDGLATLQIVTRERDAARAAPSERAGAVTEYTERARKIAAEIDVEHDDTFQDNCTVCQRIIPYITAALSAVACERDAIAIRAFGERVWSDSEEVVYGAGKADERATLLARLQTPEMREAVAVAFGEVICSQLEIERVGEGDKQRVHFTLRGKALDFSAATDAALAVITKELT